jgi:predicted nucleotidyltransferase
LRERIGSVLVLVADALESCRLEFVVGGGLAAEAYGLRQSRNDIDVFVRPIDAPPARNALASRGFHVWIEDPRWLYKAKLDDVVVDIIYESAGLVHVGEDTFQRARRISLGNVTVPVMPPEDLFVMKSAAASPMAPKHWSDALLLLESQPMDWEYLTAIAGRNARQVLRAIVQAHDDGVPVPSFVFVRLAHALIK